MEAKVNSYRVPTDHGVYVLRDPYATVAVPVSQFEESAGFRNLKINSVLEEHKTELDGLVWVCQERRELKGFVAWYQYFARPSTDGGFYFVPRGKEDLAEQKAREVGWKSRAE